MNSYFEKQKEVSEVVVVEDTQEPVVITEKTLEYLNETRKWSMFIGVFYVVIAGLMLLLGFFLLVAGSKENIPSAGLISVFYIVSAVLLFVPMWFLVCFSRFAKQAVKERNAACLEEALKQQKLFFVSAGIMVILSLIFMLAFMVAGFTMGAVSALMQSQNV